MWLSLVSWVCVCLGMWGWVRREVRMLGIGWVVVVWFGCCCMGLDFCFVMVFIGGVVFDMGRLLVCFGRGIGLGIGLFFINVESVVRLLFMNSYSFVVIIVGMII